MAEIVCQLRNYGARKKNVKKKWKEKNGEKSCALVLANWITSQIDWLTRALSDLISNASDIELKKRI